MRKLIRTLGYCTCVPRFKLIELTFFLFLLFFFYLGWGSFDSILCVKEPGRDCVPSHLICSHSSNHTFLFEDHSMMRQSKYPRTDKFAQKLPPSDFRFFFSSRAVGYTQDM